jgi:hypothetical protein
MNSLFFLLSYYRLRRACNLFGFEYRFKTYMMHGLWILSLSKNIYVLVDVDCLQGLFVRWDLTEDGNYIFKFQAQNISNTLIRSKNLFSFEINDPNLGQNPLAIERMIISAMKKASILCELNAQSNSFVLRCLSQFDWEKEFKEYLVQMHP